MIKKNIVAIAILMSMGCIMSKTSNSLRKYQSKRNFKVSPEPSAAKALASKPKVKAMTKTKKSKNPIFVIQKHDASHLHYDFRLEINGVLKSWAIPKGPSTDPHEKRLAIETEDHPIEYATFEGVIPEGEYGAGTVLVWDKGTFDNIKEKDGKTIPLPECYKNGHIELNLHGEKLQGGYALIHTSLGDEKRKKDWLLIKMKDEYADARRNPVNSQPKSVISGKTIEEMAVPTAPKASKGRQKKK
jgi:DNA ligase D-like protein (predicted 3'-phosphoesterase)